MSLSEDEDEFQSADEETYDDKKENKAASISPHEEQIKSSADVIQSSSSKSNQLAEVVEDDDDDEILAERIRERNLKIARKFSAEISKNIKSSAPIPVNTLASKVNRLEQNNDGLLDDAEYPSSNPPPAPPPTPALSSSFSNSQDPTVSAITTSELKEDCDSTGSKFRWRQSAQNVPNSRQPELKPNPTVDGDKKSKSSDARAALDRLADNLSSDNRNLFEKVAEDLKKVSIIPDNTQPGTSSLTVGSIPIISDIGSSLGSWNWNSASKLLASASQVSSQVGSVIDSVVNVTQNTQQPRSPDTNPPEDLGPRKQTSEKTQSGETNASLSATDAISNDAIVGFTLNAMESLGKKAFGVMTERDESGSLQIKGLGRPWEHLLSLKKGSESFQEQEPSDTQKTELDEPITIEERKTEDEQPILRNIRRRKKADNDELD